MKLFTLTLSAVLAAPAAADTGAAFDGALGEALKISLERAPEVEGTAVTWVPEAPPERPGGGGGDNVSSPDEDEFWDRLQSKAFDQICKNVKLQPGVDFDLGDYVDIGSKYKRRLRRYPNGEWALVEETELEGAVSWGERLVELTGQSGVQLQFGGRLDGTSHVVRPLGKTSSCREIGRLLKVWDAKFALPVTAERMSEMAVGELWKLPLTLGVRAGVAVGEWTEDLAVSVSYRRGRDGRASVSLYRMAEDKLRFRLRLDRAETRDRNFNVTYWLPAVETGLPTLETVILKQALRAIDRALAKEINQYLEIRLGLERSSREGKQVLLEYVLDPRDRGQMEALDRVIDGDLDVLGMLTQMVGRTLRILEDESESRAELADLQQEHDAALGAASTFAGIDEYERNPNRFFLMLPFIFEHEWQWGDETDRYVLADEAGGEFKVFRRHDGSESAFLDIPVLGQITKHNERETVQTFTYTDAEGKTSDPVAIYLHQEGFLRASAPTARRMVGKVDRIMRLAGTRGEGSNPDTALPPEDIVPGDLGRREVRRLGPRSSGTRTRYDQYKRGVQSFSLVFGRQAMRDIVAAPRETIYAAYANSLTAESRRLFEAALRHAEHDEDGGISVNTFRAAAELGFSRGPSKGNDAKNKARQKMRALASTAANLVRDLERARRIEDPTARAERFAELLAGEGKSDLAYADLAAVFVQLTDPLHLSARLMLRIDKDVDGEEDVDARLALNSGHADTELVAHAARTRARFAEPSELRD